MLFVILIGVAGGLAAAAEISHVQLLNGVLDILALLMVLLAFLTKNYTYLFEAIMSRKGGGALVLNAGEAFTLAPGGNAIVRRERNGVYASSFVRIPIFKSGSEMTAEEREEMSRLFGRVLTVSKSPMKLTSQLYVINKDAYIGKIRGMLNVAEDKYRNMQSLGGEQHRAALERARGEVTMWRNLLDSVSASQSQAMVTYAMVTALGGNEEEATNIAYQRAEELAGGISAVLGVSASVVTGEEMLTLLEPEHMIPVETVSERIRQKTMGAS